MYPTKKMSIQNTMPPLPPATLVVDMRGEGEDVIEMLKIEIRNLTEEMQQQKIRLWGSLSNVIAFEAIEPMTDDEIKKIRSSGQKQSSPATITSPQDKATSYTSRKTSLTGGTGFFDPSYSFPPQYNPLNQDDLDEELDDLPAPHADFRDLIEEIDSLRNIRINAVSDLGRDGTIGRNVKEPNVRVIFLTDARNFNSLQSTACCAWYLKKYYSRLERSIIVQQQIPINVSVLCLNHPNINQEAPPTRLIHGLRWNESWEHLDSLILSEKYREDIGRVDSATQNLLAELLLYALLIVPPVPIRPASSLQSMLPTQKDERPDEQKISLPPHTFTVGLSSIENSTRWGYQLLNYGLAEQALQILTDGNLSNEQVIAVPAVEGWLNEFKGRVRHAIFNQMLIHQVQEAHTQNIFSNSQLSLNAGERSVNEIDTYTNTLAATYVPSAVEPETDFATTSPTPSTLQDILFNLPLLENELDQWNEGKPETPLVRVQLEAHRVLSHARLFQGPRGALPRAKVQLRELANATTALQEKLIQNPINVEEKLKTLQKTSQERVKQFKKHVEKWPLLAAALNFKTPLAWITVFLTLLLCFTLVTLGFAVVTQSSSGFFHALSSPVFGSGAFTSFYLLLALVMIILFLVAIFGIGRWLLDKRRTPIQIEATFAVALLTIAIAFLLSWRSSSLVKTPSGQQILGWIPLGLRAWGGVLLFFLFLVLVIVEIFYYFWWRGEMEQERQAVATDIQDRHRKNIEEVTSYIVDKLTLRLLINAGLSDEKTKNSIYYKRIEDLNRLLTNTLDYAREKRHGAEERLGMHLDESSLHIREELLDVAALKRGYKRLGAAMTQNKSELRDLAEILLRSMGEEMPHHIEHQLREKAPATNRDAYYAQTLMRILTAVTLRFSISIPASDVLNQLQGRYRDLESQDTHSLNGLSMLFDSLNKKITAADLDENDRSTRLALSVRLDPTLAGQAMSAWSQMHWEDADAELSTILEPGGVVHKLINQNYNPQAVKEMLGLRTSPSGRSMVARSRDELFLFAAPSLESKQFLRDFLPERNLASFPDAERLLLMHIQYYVAQSLVQPREMSSATKQLGAAGSALDDDVIDSSLSTTATATFKNAEDDEDDDTTGAPEEDEDEDLATAATAPAATTEDEDEEDEEDEDGKNIP